MLIKRFLLFIAAVLLFCSYTADEELAIEFIKSDSKYPNSVQILKIKSLEYTWPYDDKGMEYEYFYNSKRINRVELKESTMIDSVAIYKRWFAEAKGTWISMTYKHDYSGNGDFQQLSPTLVVVDCKVYTIVSFGEARERKELYKSIRLDNTLQSLVSNKSWKIEYVNI